jgi:hypothetical protein
MPQKISFYNAVNYKVNFSSNRFFYNFSLLYNYNYLRVCRFNLFFIDYKVKLKYTRYFFKDFLVYQKKLKKKFLNKNFSKVALYDKKIFNVLLTKL